MSAVAPSPRSAHQLSLGAFLVALAFAPAGIVGSGCARAPGNQPVARAPAAAVPPLAPAAAPAPASQAQAASAAADARGPVHFAIIGDYGVDQQSARDVAKLVHSWAPDYVVTTGDNNYNDGAAKTFDVNVASLYGRYIAFAPSYRGAYAQANSPQQRFFPSLGNHDWRTPGARPYLDALALPGNGRYYTARQGPVELFVVDSDKHEPDGNTADSVQGRWLKAALAKSDAAYKLVVFHHPPYSVGPHGSSLWMRWPFKASGATAVFNGHNHDYERYEVDGLPYIVNGMGGADLARLPQPCTLAGTQFAHCVGAIYGAMVVDGDAERLRVRAITTAGTEIDSFALRGR